MVRATYRFREHTLTPAPDDEPTSSALACKGCGEASEPSTDATDGTAWAADHLKANPGHLTYREIITRSYRFKPGAWQ
ncbi:hypothetical protein [Streptomyces sp. R08]|uniref:DUF7848 domain-containing protein n=1 Tax=Streptomyces sp. R08 TaxID=3238624 RepID=A0AB39MMM2_9ACTN